MKPQIIRLDQHTVPPTGGFEGLSNFKPKANLLSICNGWPSDGTHCANCAFHTPMCFSHTVHRSSFITSCLGFWNFYRITVVPHQLYKQATEHVCYPRPSAACPFPTVSRNWTHCQSISALSVSGYLNHRYAVDAVASKLKSGKGIPHSSENGVWRLGQKGSVRNVNNFRKQTIISWPEHTGGEGPCHLL